MKLKETSTESQGKIPFDKRNFSTSRPASNRTLGANILAQTTGGNSLRWETLGGERLRSWP